MSNRKQVAKLPEKENLPAPFEMDAGDAQLGGRVTSADLALPFLKILQGLSGQLKRESPIFIKGAAIGDICLTVLNKWWPGDEGVEMIFCHYSRVFVEWRPLEMGGGRINTYLPENLPAEIIRGEKGTLSLPNGHNVIETAYHATLTKVDDRWIQSVLPLKGTMLKYSKRMNNQLENFEVPNGDGYMRQAPRWARRWKMTSGTEISGGNSWAIPVWESQGLVDRETYQLGKKWALAAGKDAATTFSSAESAQTSQEETSNEF